MFVSIGNGNDAMPTPTTTSSTAASPRQRLHRCPKFPNVDLMPELHRCSVAILLLVVLF